MMENQNPSAEAQQQEIVAAETIKAQQEQTAEQRTYNNTADIIIRVKEMAQDPLNASKEELEQLKQTFYKLHRAAVEAARQAHLDNGFAPEDFKTDNTDENEYKAAVAIIKEQRAEQQRKIEQQREENSLRKEAILERLQAMLDNADVEQASYNDFKALQQEWKSIGEVPATKATDLWKSYQVLTERFYDILKLSIEFREYDFKKNLEAKTRLCEAAERLADEQDVISAFHQLQKLHEEFREIGPVAKELREEVWNRFKTASTAVNKRHQQHFEELKERENANLEKKTALCEKVEGIDFAAFETYNQWNDKTQEIIALQEEWKTIGFAPQKMNNKIFERFRAACDAFFQRKAEFYKDMKDGLNANLEKKIALCEKAEALQNNTDWKATTDKFTALQREWKSIGAVPKKQSDAIWKRFNTACDTFFDNRKAATSSQRSEEQQNLDKKKAVIEALSAIKPETATAEDQAKMHDLIKEWNSIGHVPFREKDKVYKQYKALIDTLFDTFRKNEATKKVVRYKESIKEGTNVVRERERLLRIYENMCNEIKTYENNLGFLSSSSKSGNSLVAEMQRKMEKLKDDAQLVLKKIAVLEEKES